MWSASKLCYRPVRKWIQVSIFKDILMLMTTMFSFRDSMRPHVTCFLTNIIIITVIVRRIKGLRRESSVLERANPYFQSIISGFISSLNGSFGKYIWELYFSDQTNRCLPADYEWSAWSVWFWNELKVKYYPKKLELRKGIHSCWTDVKAVKEC